MNKFGYLLLVIGLFVGCASSQKLLEKGRYDKAISKSAKALRKHPNDAKQLHVLKEAFTKANAFDKEQIDFLKKEDRKENSFKIYKLYTSLKNRQDVIRSIPTKDREQFTLVNYDDQIINSKKRAVDNFYQEGLTLLNRGGKQNARVAFLDFEKVSNIYPNYQHVNRLINEAHYAGMNNVLFRIKNNSNVILPKNFNSELKKISLKGLNTRWINYDTYQDTSINYDYYIVLNINKIKVSPEAIDRKSYTDIKKIQDGMKYVLDANGNVKRDSAGNDIKVPNMVTVTANVTESIQHKETLIGGSIDYVDLVSKQLIKSDPVSVHSVFNHYSADYKGNKKALSKESRKIIGGHPVPFPSDKQMLMDTARLLKDHSKTIIYNNKRILAD